jgi:hypothetical protein
MSNNSQQFYQQALKSHLEDHVLLVDVLDSGNDILCLAFRQCSRSRAALKDGTIALELGNRLELFAVE